MDTTWLYRFKRKIIIGLALLIALSISAAMLGAIFLLRSHLLKDNAEHTKQLGAAITASLKDHMLTRSPELIQRTVSDIARNDRIAKMFIINRNGLIAFSSLPGEVGKQLDRLSDHSCHGCHQAPGGTVSSKTIVLAQPGGDVHRNVTVIYNEPACFGCHPSRDRINGKLIIDNTLASTYRLINTIEAIILLAGAACVMLVVPFLSRMINRYIDEIVIKTREMSLVYSILDNISKTIDLEELKGIVLDIVSDALSASEVDIVLPKGDNGFRVITRSADGTKILRKKLEPEDRLAGVVTRWLNNELRQQSVSSDRREVYLPIEKGDHRLALIAVRSSDVPFPDDRLTLVGAVCNHIAIAFENARLYSIAISDELTGLFTVRHFRFCIDREITTFERYGEKFALLMVDIDNFKKVNDTYGHIPGDAVLKQVAGCIAESIRGNDIGFRYGGEEFAVLLPATAFKGALHVAERIRALVEATEMEIDGISIRSTVSIGVAVCPDNAETAKELTIAADQALYAAKHGGKNRVKSAGAAKGDEPTADRTA